NRLRGLSGTSRNTSLGGPSRAHPACGIQQITRDCCMAGTVTRHAPCLFAVSGTQHQSEFTDTHQYTRQDFSVTVVSGMWRPARASDWRTQLALANDTIPTD